MLGGLAMHGKGKAVLQMFTKMLEEAKPDDLTFIGLVDQGRKYFLNLQSEYGIIPKIDHYACMVDLLGRAGHVEEAGVLIENMPMPPNEVVLGSLNIEEKEQALLFHSEKLALCFGLISTGPGTPLYIFKNLRICHDCHSAMKIASRVYQREIVVRDRNRFHCFRHGSCSCSDYW
ncbi:Pentatricopeptide repeat-containing protein At5g15340, mitochondrial [Linum perenne]